MNTENACGRMWAAKRLSDLHWTRGWARARVGSPHGDGPFGTLPADQHPLSTHHCPGQTGTVNRRSGHVEQQRVVVPATLADYQQNMKGVDLSHNALVVAKGSNEEYCRREWPGLIQDFLEDLVENRVDDRTSSRAPPNRLVARPTAQLYTLRAAPDGLHKLCYEGKRKGLKPRNSNK
ncbi:hypothetical protein RRG08_037181 [Elysia crispata]|uniref:Uncharacterized protein n=1 Tax=Elysia crispata TaxID=231223 RepID=A0AAE0Z387_9GAST|nr:hypothetical protein RRG08_037181 [Elysia crispata]